MFGLCVLRTWRYEAGMQTRPFLSSEPLDIPVNAALNRTPTAPAVPCFRLAGRGSRSVPAAYPRQLWRIMGYHGIEWDYKGKIQANPRIFRGTPVVLWLLL